MVGALVGMAWDGVGMMGLDAGLAFCDARVYGFWRVSLFDNLSWGDRSLRVHFINLFWCRDFFKFEQNPENS